MAKTRSQTKNQSFFPTRKPKRAPAATKKQSKPVTKNKKKTTTKKVTKTIAKKTGKKAPKSRSTARRAGGKDLKPARMGEGQHATVDATTTTSNGTRKKDAVKNPKGWLEYIQRSSELEEGLQSVVRLAQLTNENTFPGSEFLHEALRGIPVEYDLPGEGDDAMEDTQDEAHHDDREQVNATVRRYVAKKKDNRHPHR